MSSGPPPGRAPQVLMHTTLSLIAATTTTVAGNKSSSSSSLPLLIIILVFAGAYFLLIRPRQQKMRQQQVAARQLEVGDEVVTAGGIHGTLVALRDDTAEVEVAPGVVMTFLRRAVNAKPRPVGQAVEEPVEDPGDEDHEPGETAGPAS